MPCTGARALKYLLLCLLFKSGCKYTCHLRCKDEVLLECDGGLVRNAKEMTREEITLKTLEILSQVQHELYSSMLTCSFLPTVYSIYYPRNNTYLSSSSYCCVQGLKQFLLDLYDIPIL